MTSKVKRIKFDTLMGTLRPSPFRIEIRKSSRGAVAVISGIMCISEYSEQEVVLLSHSGRLILSGEYLSISVLENRVLEIYGRIEEVRMSYGNS